MALLSGAFPSSLVGHLETCRGRCGVFLCFFWGGKKMS